MTATTTAEHPVYTSVLASKPSDRTDGMRTYWMDTTDTAKLVRTALARAFPGVRFSVRSDRYAGGSSIRVSYTGRLGYLALASCYCTEGPQIDPAWGSHTCRRCGYMGRAVTHYAPGIPSETDVNAVLAPFEGKGFDGSIDLAYYGLAWLAPDGSASFAYTDGTEGSRGYVRAAYGDPHHPSAVLVHMGADYVSASVEGPYDTIPSAYVPCAWCDTAVLVAAADRNALAYCSPEHRRLAVYIPGAAGNL